MTGGTRAGALAGAGAGTAGGLLVIGDVVTDIVARHTTPLAAATDTAAEISILPGGAGANVACWAAHAGVGGGTDNGKGTGTGPGADPGAGADLRAVDVRLLACVGPDSAEWHEEALVRSGVRPILRVDPEAHTAKVISLVDATAERTFLTDSGAALRLTPDDWSDDLLEGVAHLHLSGYLFFADSSRAHARVAMKAARAHSIPVSVDPASAGFIERLGVDLFLQSIAGADLLTPNLAEAQLLTGLSEPADMALKLSHDFPLVALTLGADGALLAAEGQLLAHVPAPPATPVDTTGAGDAFTGTLLAARLSGATPVSSARTACQAASRSATYPGGRPYQPSARVPPVD
ncbi:carbohydrate kinase family protein [Streptomyces sp. 8N616]|uniref:carbohydrate kinase family protein n=1 Tax=Streptomyces sp. 8N616 TaxID=3457414 RepID=UPI003FCF6CEF